MIRKRDRCFQKIILCGVIFGSLLIVESSSADTSTLASIQLPEGFEVSLAASSDLSAYPMFMEFDDRGRLFIAESTGKDLSGKEMAAAPECTILRLVDENGDGVYDSRTVFARELSLPMGVLWHQDALYVASPPDFVRFEDTDDDGVADKREVLLTGWNVFNTASLHGPFLGPDGLLYLTHGRHGYKITTKEGELLEGLASRIWRCKPDGTELERFAGGGFDNPVEVIFTPGGEMLGTMTYFTDPQHGQRDGLMHWVWGGVYPKPHESVSEFVRTGDLMPVMSKYSRIAPSGLIQYRSGSFGEAYHGNLFSAQFNPHRVMHHRLIRDGATWRTEDEDFLTSTNPDFYPTDVLEDADGSLLVSDTGAWYVDACPISRVAKPNVKGSIYRIRRIDATSPDDPWGHALDWDHMQAIEHVELLDDPRFRVRQRALQAVVARGEESIAPLGALIPNTARAETCTLAVSALKQIGGTATIPTLTAALGHDNEAVQVAVARALGELGDALAVDSLLASLQKGTPPVRREAATALGKIGSAVSTEGLLKAAAKAADRFEEHAIIYALIEIADTAALLDTLRGQEPLATRKAALIAVDQLELQGLAAADVIPFLESDDAAMRETALWVASRHGEWANEILDFVAQGIAGPNRGALRDILLAYADTEAGQEFVASRIMNRSAPIDLRRFLLGVIEEGTTGDLPPTWKETIDWCLHEEKLLFDTMGVIQFLGLGQFDERLIEIADYLQSFPVKLEALVTLSSRLNELSDSHLRDVLFAMQPKNHLSTRRKAATVLATVPLDTYTQRRLVAEYLPGADALTLSTVLTALKGASDTALGTLLVETMAADTGIKRMLTLPQLDRALDGFPAHVKDVAAPLREELLAQAEGTMQRFLALEPRLGTGDVGRGRAMFFSELAQCSQCHAIGDEGGNLGPDLTTIGVVRSGHDLLEAVLFPNSSMVPDYVPYLIETEDDFLAGIVQEETADTITLGVGVNDVRRIARTDILSMRPHTISLMPEGLDAAFTEEQMIDLITFLMSLNNERWLLPELWEGKEGH